MSHSPRLVNNELLVLLSATGELARILPKSGKFEVIASLQGFVRGMTSYKDYLFIGLSKLRTNSSGFQDLPIAEKSHFCEIVISHLSSMSVVGHLKYETSVEEIYDVLVPPNMLRPGLLNHEKGVHKMAITSPLGDFWVT